MALTTQAHLPSLGEHQRDEVGNQLPALLVELVDLVEARRRPLGS